MVDPISDLLPDRDAPVKPENPIDWDMYRVKNDSKWEFSIPVNDSTNSVPVTFKAGQIRVFPLHRAKWLAMQLAKRIITEEWKEEELATGRQSTKLWLTADLEHMAKEAGRLLLGKDVEEVIEPPKVSQRGEALKKWREEQKALKQA